MKLRRCAQKSASITVYNISRKVFATKNTSPAVKRAPLSNVRSQIIAFPRGPGKSPERVVPEQLPYSVNLPLNMLIWDFSRVSNLINEGMGLDLIGRLSMLLIILGCWREITRNGFFFFFCQVGRKENRLAHNLAHWASAEGMGRNLPTECLPVVNLSSDKPWFPPWTSLYQWIGGYLEKQKVGNRPTWYVSHSNMWFANQKENYWRMWARNRIIPRGVGWKVVPAALTWH